MTAKYLQILRDLSRRVDAMQPGDALPSEEELAREFSASPMTVRRALTILLDAKRIVGVRGRGTFVAPRAIRRSMTLGSFTDTMQATGRIPRAEVLGMSMEAAGAGAADLLGIAADEQVYRIRRLRFGDDTPVGIDRTLLAAERFPGLLGHDLTGSLYALLREQYGVAVQRASSTISAVLPDAEDREGLRLGTGVPCLSVRGIASDDESRVVEVTDSTYRGDLYSLRVDHSAAPDTVDG